MPRDQTTPAIRAAASVGGRRSIRAMRVNPLETMDELVAQHGDAVEQVLKPPDPERMRKGAAIQRIITGDNRA